MPSYKVIAGSLAALCSTACSLQPAFQRPAPPLAATYPSGPAYAADSGAAGRSADQVGWRDCLRDARLQRLIELALLNNRDLRVAALNVEQVRAQYLVQRASLFPQVGIGAGATASGGPARTETRYSSAVTVSWELDFFGRLRSLSDAAREQYFASLAARRAAQILLVAQVAQQYFSVLAYGEELAVTQHTIDAATASSRLVNLQYENGVASELDLRQAQSVVDLANANRLALVRLRAQAENGLVLLVGQPLPADLPPPTPLDGPLIVADIPPGLPSDLLMRRPDILQAEAVLRARTANVGAARAALFPRIALTGTAGTASATLSGLFDGANRGWTLLPSLLLPVFNAGANQANLDLAQAQRAIAMAQYEKAIQLAFREVADGLAARGTYADQLAALSRNAADQQRRLALANMRFESGTDSYLNVLTAQGDLYSAQIALVTARLNQLSSLVDLYRALGGGWLEGGSAG